MRPFFADQKYLAEGEALLGSEAAFLISFCFSFTLIDWFSGIAAKTGVIVSLSRLSSTPKNEPIWTFSPVSSRTSMAVAEECGSRFTVSQFALRGSWPSFLGHIPSCIRSAREIEVPKLKALRNRLLLAFCRSPGKQSTRRDSPANVSG
jgi:hypothetical protein